MFFDFFLSLILSVNLVAIENFLFEVFLADVCCCVDCGVSSILCDIGIVDGGEGGGTDNGLILDDAKSVDFDCDDGGDKGSKINDVKAGADDDDDARTICCEGGLSIEGCSASIVLCSEVESCSVAS